METEQLFSDLEFPVSIAFAADGRMFYNERLTGRIRLVQEGHLLLEPFADVNVANDGEMGLLGLAVDPDFSQNGFVYVYHTYISGSGPLNRVVRFRANGNIGEDMTVLLDGIPASILHNGGILEFGPDDMLYIFTGDAMQREQAQNPNFLGGKVLRINREGSIPEDNPTSGSPVYSLGHRNIFGAAFHPSTGRLYITENGPVGNDELNLIEAGGNYGWPLVTGAGGDLRFVDPILTFASMIAPTEAAFYEGGAYPARYGDNFFFGNWNLAEIQRLVVGSRGEILIIETILQSPDDGVLDVEQGPDGRLYFSTPSRIVRINVLGP